jgi:hypothetical protein
MSEGAGVTVEGVLYSWSASGGRAHKNSSAGPLSWQRRRCSKARKPCVATEFATFEPGDDAMSVGYKTRQKIKKRIE